MLTTTKRLLMRCIATLCVATVFLVRAEDADASIATQLAKLLADDGAASDWFGKSVAISDGIAVIGAYQDDDKGSSSGSVYVFEMSSSGDASSFTQVAKLTADDGAKDDDFGYEVAISDGIIVVGAYYDDDNGSASGSVYVFEMSSPGDASSFAQVAKLTADDGASGDQFGTSVAISDGTIIAGANQDDDNGSNSGSVYLFEKSSSDDASSWAQVAKLTADDGTSSDKFGHAVAISDGTAVVGSWLDDDKGSKSGSAYLFQKSSSGDAGSWTQVAKLTADDGAAVDHFGKYVAISDGIAVVSANKDDDNGSNSGSVYVFEMSSPGDASSFTQVVKLTADDATAADIFGTSVAISDGTIVVGANKDDDKGSDSGSVYVFEKSSSDDASSWAQVAKLTADDGEAGAEFGIGVAISDGIAVIGAHCVDDKGSDSGSAYIFRVKTEPPPPSPPPTPPPPPSPPPSPPPPTTVYTTTFEDRTFTTTVVKQDDGTFKESVSSSPLSALGLAPGGPTFPRVSAVVAVVAFVALLASVAVRRARETNVDHRQEGEVLLNSNKYGAVNA